MVAVDVQVVSALVSTASAVVSVGALAAAASQARSAREQAVSATDQAESARRQVELAEEELRLLRAEKADAAEQARVQQAQHIHVLPVENTARFFHEETEPHRVGCVYSLYLENQSDREIRDVDVVLYVEIEDGSDPRRGGFTVKSSAPSPRRPIRSSWSHR
jgi:hypothetical protein